MGGKWVLDANIIIELLNGKRRFRRNMSDTKSEMITNIIAKGSEIYLLDIVAEEIKRIMKTEYDQTVTSDNEIMNQLSNILKDICIKKCTVDEIEQIPYPANDECLKKRKDESGNKLKKINIGKTDKRIAKFTEQAGDLTLFTCDKALHEFCECKNIKCVTVFVANNAWTDREQFEFVPIYSMTEKSSIILRQIGISMMELGIYKEAVEYFDKALDICPEDVETLSYKGAALGMLGKLDESLECHRPIAKHDNYITLYNTGRTLCCMHEFTDAEKYFEAALDKISENNHEIKANILSYKGFSLGMQNIDNSDEAIKLHNDAIQMSKNRTTLYNKGRTMYERGIRFHQNGFDDKSKNDLEEALTCFQMIDGDTMNTNENNAMIASYIALTNSAIAALLGDANKSFGYYKKNAIRNSKISIKQDNQNALIHYNNGNLLLRLGMFGDALASFKIAEYTKKQNLDIDDAISNVYSILTIDGINIADKFPPIRDNDEFKWLHRDFNKNFNKLQNNNFQMNDKINEEFENILKRFNEQLKEKPDEVSILFLKAITLFILSKKEESLKCCEDILNISPDYDNAIELKMKIVSLSESDLIDPEEP